MTTLLEDKDAIRELLSQYCFCVDSGDAETYAAMFTEDGVWDGGPFGRRQGRPALRELIAGGPRSLRHLTTNPVITIRGETATARSYLLIVSTSSDKPPSLFFAGFCDDQFVKEAGRWLIRSRAIHAQ
jgi:uncharacterized protein (TIGR02246 family)